MGGGWFAGKQRQSKVWSIVSCVCARAEHKTITRSRKGGLQKGGEWERRYLSIMKKAHDYQHGERGGVFVRKGLIIPWSPGGRGRFRMSHGEKKLNEGVSWGMASLIRTGLWGSSAGTGCPSNHIWILRKQWKGGSGKSRARGR